MADNNDTGLLDTSVVIDFAELPDTMLPRQSFISTLTLAELAAGPVATNDLNLASQRTALLAWASAELPTLAFTAQCARTYGEVYAAERAAGRQPRSRVVDLLIAATAAAHDLPLYTRNPDDFAVAQHLTPPIDVITL